MAAGGLAVRRGRARRADRRAARGRTLRARTAVGGCERLGDRGLEGRAMSGFLTLEDAILDDSFPEVDIALRRGRHVGREDGGMYDFLCDALERLEPFYRRFGCELVQRSEGYFYLLPSGDRLGRRHLSAGEMMTGQVLALLFLDPSTLRRGGIIGRELLLQRLSQLVSTDVLVRTLNPQKKKYDERIAAEVVRTKVADALRKLQD